jgi:hypothetical protein
MKIRSALGLALAVPALVVTLAQPGSAATAGVVTFAGTFQVTPDGQSRETLVCFFGVGAACANGAESSGAAAGPAFSSDPLGPQVVDGVQAQVSYTEACTPGTGIAPVATGTIAAETHDALTGQWGNGASAQFVRAGLVAVFVGNAIGAALVTPASVPSCGGMTLAVSGSAAFLS